MKTNAISIKIRFIGSLFVALMGLILITTTYLNTKNKKDALIINIAGKERMLTQKISKNIFYHFHNKNIDFTELNIATNEFIYNLKSLKEGNPLISIEKVPTKEILNQIKKVENLWEDFFKNIQNFKKLSLENKKKNNFELQKIVNNIYNTNNHILNEVDNLVTLYTIHSEKKSDMIRYIQYFFASIIILLLAYSFSKLKSIEENAKRFFDASKEIVENVGENKEIKPLKIDAEKEIIEATDTINCFINRINSALNYSKNASSKLEEITDEFDKVLNELANSSDITKQLYKSEDIVIESQEKLTSSTKKLQQLKKELDKLISTQEKS